MVHLRSLLSATATLLVLGVSLPQTAQAQATYGPNNTAVIVVPWGPNDTYAAVAAIPAVNASVASGFATLLPNWSSDYLTNVTYPSIYGIFSLLDISARIYVLDPTDVNYNTTLSQNIPGLAYLNATDPFGRPVNVTAEVVPCCSAAGADYFDEDVLSNNAAVLSVVDGAGFLSTAYVGEALAGLLQLPPALLDNYAFIFLFVPTFNHTEPIQLPTIIVGYNLANKNASFNQASFGATEMLGIEAFVNISSLTGGLLTDEQYNDGFNLATPIIVEGSSYA